LRDEQRDFFAKKRGIEARKIMGQKNRATGRAGNRTNRKKKDPLKWGRGLRSALKTDASVPRRKVESAVPGVKGRATKLSGGKGDRVNEVRPGRAGSLKRRKKKHCC